MGLLSEGFTVLAVLEARDLASEIFDKCGVAMERFGEQAGETAGAVKGAADEIDESLATTASGVDPLELAAAKVAAAENQMAAATENLIEKQQALVAASGNVASLDAQGTAAEVIAHPRSITGQYLSGRRRIEIPSTRGKPDPKRMLRVSGANANNLKNVTAEFPLGLMTCVTGVSGSGK